MPETSADTKFHGPRAAGNFKSNLAEPSASKIPTNVGRTASDSVLEEEDKSETELETILDDSVSVEYSEEVLRVESGDDEPGDSDTIEAADVKLDWILEESDETIAEEAKEEEAAGEEEEEEEEDAEDAKKDANEAVEELKEEETDEEETDEEAAEELKEGAEEETEEEAEEAADELKEEETDKEAAETLKEDDEEEAEEEEACLV